MYVELLRRGYDVAIGKIGTKEVDFRAINRNETIYYQVTESLQDDATRTREFDPLTTIKDNYRKIVLTTDTNQYGHDGIEVVNIIDWLLAS